MVACFFISFSVFQFTMVSFAFHSLLFFKVNSLKCFCMVQNLLGNLGWIVGLILALDDCHKSFKAPAKMVRREIRNIEDETDKEDAREVLEVIFTCIHSQKITKMCNPAMYNPLKQVSSPMIDFGEMIIVCQELDGLSPLTGLGFFTIERSTLTSMVATALTYIIILLQFDMSTE